MKFEDIRKRHSFLRYVDQAAPLHGGFSKDEKYLLSIDGKPLYILRFSEIGNMKRQREEYELLRIHHGNGIRCPEPHAFGTKPDDQQCYMIVSYISGSDATMAIPLLLPDQQYEIGYEAGCELRKLHDLESKEPHDEWLARRVWKYRRRVEQAVELGLRFHEQERVERYIEGRLDLLKKSPMRFQHDDFHLANLIVRDGKFAGVVDFNRFDWGDPIEDFYKVPWFTVSVSAPFARGQIEGYLSNGEVKDFWQRFNFFVALNLHGSLVWEYENSHPSGKQEWLDHVVDMIETHNFEGDGPPSWFKG